MTPPSGDGSSESGCLAPDGSVVYACTDAASEFAQLIAGQLVVQRLDSRAGGGRAERRRPRRGTHLERRRREVGAHAARRRDRRPDRGQPPAPRRHARRRPLPRRTRPRADGGRANRHQRGVVEPVRLGTGSAQQPGAGRLHASRGASIPELDPHDVVAPQPRCLRSSDGTPIHGWLYRPAGTMPLGPRSCGCTAAQSPRNARRTARSFNHC